MNATNDIYDFHAATSVIRLFYLTPFIISIVINHITKYKYESIKAFQAIVLLILSYDFFIFFYYSMKHYTIVSQLFCIFLIIMCFIAAFRVITKSKIKSVFIIKTALSYVCIFVFYLLLGKTIKLDVSDGSSMEPNKSNGCICFKGTAINNIDKIKRGDIITFKKSVNKPGLSKRVIGMPGDKISYINDTIIINGKKVTHKNLNKKHCHHYANDNTCGDLYLELPLKTVPQFF